MASDGLDRTHAVVEAYYTSKLAEFGATPRGVDWTCAATQRLRFVQLLRVCDFSREFSLNDLGCGYGALLSFCRERHPDSRIDYAGTDLSAAMVRTARQQWLGRPGVRFFVGTRSPRVADISVASGLFNVCLTIQRDEWESYVRATLEALMQSSAKGFSANFLAPSPPGAMVVPQLYRTEPEPWIEFCERMGGRVRLLQGYGLREFTLLVEL